MSMSNIQAATASSGREPSPFEGFAGEIALLWVLATHLGWGVALQIAHQSEEDNILLAGIILGG